MLSRRSFIKVTLAVGAMPRLSCAATRASRDAALHVVVDGVCADARNFAQQCTVPRLHETAPHLIVTTLAREPTARLFGLTSDSQFFLIEQMAAAHGYHLGYHGVHDYRDGRLLHQLSGARVALDALAQAFTIAGAHWTTPLAHAVTGLAGDSVRAARVTLGSEVLRGADSSGYLVSWCLHRA